MFFPYENTLYFNHNNPIALKSDTILYLLERLYLTSSNNITLQIVELNEKDGSVKFTYLGQDLMGNEQTQYTVPPNVWFGSFPTKDINVSPEGLATKAVSRDAESHFSLVGCTCAPAFQFEDFELAKRSELISYFPKYKSLILLLTSDD